ncbi:MAG: bifunctional riboflavin kinase/FAD synthetase [Marinifilaceae bacterium]|jgi:riboflavin kinase/FMN adenylyltransferase|nr:bifunctional riboflavin kinase/FAD synthetase [Marinifilaceae bacterium]
MIIHKNIDNFNVTNPVITIGTFDGVHLGHRSVIDKLKKLAKQVNGESVIITFYPHPRIVLNADVENLSLVTCLEEKEELLAQTGIDHLVVFPFTKEFSNLSYTNFVEEILIGKLNMKSLVIGYDHRFGKNREGNYEDLLPLAKSHNFNIVRLEALNMNEINISSTKIRNALYEGNIKLANSYLAYNFFLKGVVVKGNRIGHTIGFPTANLHLPDNYKLVPQNGVYAVRVHHKNSVYQGMLNIGVRPTIEGKNLMRTIEVNIFDFDQDIYNHDLKLELIDRIRSEKKFDSLDHLKKQLHDDELTVRKIFSNQASQ